MSIAFATPQCQAAEESIQGTGYRGSYFKNGEIHVNEYGTPEGKPLTKDAIETSSGPPKK